MNLQEAQAGWRRFHELWNQFNHGEITKTEFDMKAHEALSPVDVYLNRMFRHGVDVQS